MGPSTLRGPAPSGPTLHFELFLFLVIFIFSLFLFLFFFKKKCFFLYFSFFKLGRRERGKPQTSFQFGRGGYCLPKPNSSASPQTEKAFLLLICGNPSQCFPSFAVRFLVTSGIFWFLLVHALLQLLDSPVLQVRTQPATSSSVEPRSAPLRLTSRCLHDPSHAACGLARCV